LTDLPQVACIKPGFFPWPGPDFVNAKLCGFWETRCSRTRVLAALHDIEAALVVCALVPWASRVIDLDLLALVIWSSRILRDTRCVAGAFRFRQQYGRSAGPTYLCHTRGNAGPWVCAETLGGCCLRI